MRLLLDTHALLWSSEAPDKLSIDARRELESPENSLFFSAASVWELAIKISVGKLRLSLLLDDLLKILLSRGFEELPVEAVHASKVASMPLHHRDPFDRLLIAQAEIESMTLVSKDDWLDAYGVRRLW